ncbi:MAG: ATP-binding protein, partial [Chloroflexi bacterium]|nr:ATP-binding protein [Chloroflexota bacterium]
PDSFLSDPSVSPDTVATALGYDQEPHELFEITVEILGYFDAVMGFVNPRVPPPSGTPIYIATNEQLSAVLCRLQPGQVGSAHIGSLLSRPAGSVPIVLDARGFTSTHMAIIASTGSGKSYLAGVLLEELMQPHNRAAVLVIDPHAEYDTLTEMEAHPAFQQGSYKPRVRILRPNEIKVRINSLTLADLRYLLSGLSERMNYLLGQAYNRVQRKVGKQWNKGNLLVEVRAGIKGQVITDPASDETEDVTVGALVWRLNQLLDNSVIFDDHLNLPLNDLLRPGQCTVLQLNEIPAREQQVVVATLLRRLNQARMDTVRGRNDANDEDYIPYPAFVLIEEAHNFAPANADLITSDILKQILAEGRKFGVSVGLISQRPGKLDGDVLSQCMTQCIMRIVNPVDQARVAESIESVGRDLLAELPALSKGQVIVAGASVNTPVTVQVRQRLTRHGAEDLDAPAQWQQYFTREAEMQRKRDSARPADAPPDTEDPLARYF